MFQMFLKSRTLLCCSWILATFSVKNQFQCLEWGSTTTAKQQGPISYKLRTGSVARLLYSQITIPAFYAVSETFPILQLLIQHCEQCIVVTLYHDISVSPTRAVTTFRLNFDYKVVSPCAQDDVLASEYSLNNWLIMKFNSLLKPVPSCI